MISEHERRKCEEEMREWMGGNITIPDCVSPYSIGRGRIKRISKKEPEKKRISIVTSVARIINHIVRK